MTDELSARLSLPYLAAGQMQKHVTLNEALTRLDVLVATAVVSRTTADQPALAEDGDLYILPADATGEAWAELPEGALARFENGGWSVAPVFPGLIALVKDSEEVVVRTADHWRLLAELLDEVQELTRLGVGTRADDANPFAVKANKMLLTAQEAETGGDGDLRLTLNKQRSEDVLSLLFQSGYGGRAELGLVGGDDLSLKVSADGDTWRQALAVDQTTGRVSFDQGAMRSETTVFAASGGYAVPAWAQRVEVLCVGGGGGGGAGQAGPSGTARLGGGGGGAGGQSEGRWAARDLGAALTVTVGGGGLPGEDGGASVLTLGALTLVSAGGGRAGADGSVTSQGGGESGAGRGGLGMRPGNPGGASSLGAAGEQGAHQVCVGGAGGGGAGGALDVANNAQPGGGGASGGWASAAATQSTGAGSHGVSAASPELSWAGSGGGGGSASAAGAGVPGGDGGAFGAGGGGGGAGLTSGGTGGNGGSGLVCITVFG